MNCNVCIFCNDTNCYAENMFQHDMNCFDGDLGRKKNSSDFVFMRRSKTLLEPRELLIAWMNSRKPDLLFV